MMMNWATMEPVEFEIFFILLYIVCSNHIDFNNKTYSYIALISLYSQYFAYILYIKGSNNKCKVTIFYKLEGTSF